MASTDASEAREKLYNLLEETDSDHEPVLITGPRSNAVLVAEEDWNSIQETLYLLLWLRKSANARKNRAGDGMEGRIHEAGAKRCPSHCSTGLRP